MMVSDKLYLLIFQSLIFGGAAYIGSPLAWLIAVIGAGIILQNHNIERKINRLLDHYGIVPMDD